MQAPAGDDRTSVLLLRRYQSVGCYYCRGKDSSTPHAFVSCPYRPCYLCKQSGHISSSCPYRPNQRPTPPDLSSKFAYLRQRELSNAVPHPSTLHIEDPQQSASAVAFAYVFHKIRITAAEWHPSGNCIVSADKHGEVMLWNLGSALSQDGLDVNRIPKQSTCGTFVHECNVNQIVFGNNPSTLYTSSADGLVCASDLTTLPKNSWDIDENKGEPCLSERTVLQNFNPDGWQGSISRFRMVHGLCFHKQRRSLYCGLSDGSIVAIDPREEAVKTRARFHRHKVVCLDIHPVADNLLVSSSNDRLVSLWDIRKFAPGHELGYYRHGGVVSSAYFSPCRGNKLLTTSTDNRIQVWDSIHKFLGDVNEYEDSQPITFVHSHDFHRHLNPFRAAWDPKDWNDDRFICGRFLGEAYRDKKDLDKELILHPLDFFSVKEKRVTASIVDMKVPLKCPLNKFSKHGNAILSVASRDLMIWSPGKKAGDEESMDEDDSSDEDITRAKRSLLRKKRGKNVKRARRDDG